MEQTKWLLDAGVRHALEQIQNQPNYSEQNLVISPLLKEHSTASIEITVTRNDESDEKPRLLMVARIGSDEQQIDVAKRSVELVLESSK